MKKKIALALSLAMLVFIIAGCGSNTSNPAGETTAATTQTETTAATTGETTGTAAGNALKTGLAVVTSIASSKDAGEADGLAQTDSTVIALTVDAAGKIVDCKIDAAQTKINFSKEGKIVTPLDTVMKTKQEKGAEYGMAKASGIGKEWNDQANAFAAYVIGKTVDEVKGIALNEKGAPTDAELSSSVTVHVNEFMAAIEKAVANAKDLGAKSGDKLGLGIVTTINKSTDAGEKEGLAQAYSMYTATTFDAAGKITSSIIDGSQANVNFTKEGKITSDLKAAPKTKNELGPEYGMKKASAIGKEWNEQAEAFAKYVVGKNVEEVKGIALNEKGTPADAELSSSVTIHTSDFTTIIEKASVNAK